MEKMKVRDLMRPVEEFPSISNEATFIEAVLALEKAQQEFNAGKAPEMIVMVNDARGKIVGKISPMDVVQGLEPNYDRIDDLQNLSTYRIPQSVLDSIKEQFRLWQKPLGELCKRAYSIKIRDFVKLPAPDHIVMADDNIDAAFHLFVLRRHGSLFVKQGEDIVGLIRFSDVYDTIRQTIRECPQPSL